MLLWQSTDTASYFSFHLKAIVCVMTNLLLSTTENAVILHCGFFLSDFHFSLIFLEGEIASPYCRGLASALRTKFKMPKIW